MTRREWTLAALAHEWGDAYLLSYCRDRWVALRRDKRYFLVADTLDELEAAVRADYRERPVPRTFDPPNAGDYLDEADGVGEAGTWKSPMPEAVAADEQDGDALLGPETRMILAELRQLFPYWEISYSAELGTWMARSTYGSFCEHSIALVWVALARMERRIDWD